MVGTFRRVCPDWKDDSAWRLADALMMQVNASYGALPIDSACTFSLALAAEDLAQTLERDGIVGSLYDAHFSRAAAKALWALAHDARSAPEMFAVHRKGFGVTCSDPGGIKKGDLVVDFLGEMYPPWAWMAKQDAIKTAQKAKGQRESGPPEFYNMQLERPSGDAEGFALLFVDAMHHNNYSSRLSHSCDPNVEVSLRAIDGKYCINFYAKKHIKPGEELCYNYHSCTDNMKEVEAAFCLCGARLCRASYLAFVGEQSNSHVLTRCHRLVERHAALFAAGLPVSSSSGDKKETPSSGDKTEANSVLSSNAISALAEIGLYPNKGLLRNAPGWLVKYVGSVALFMAVELKRLPKDILREHKGTSPRFPNHPTTCCYDCPPVITSSVCVCSVERREEAEFNLRFFWPALQATLRSTDTFRNAKPHSRHGEGARETRKRALCQEMGAAAVRAGRRRDRGAFRSRKPNPIHCDLLIQSPVLARAGWGEEKHRAHAGSVSVFGNRDERKRQHRSGFEVFRAAPKEFGESFSSGHGAARAARRRAESAFIILRRDGRHRETGLRKQKRGGRGRRGRGCWRRLRKRRRRKRR